MKENPLDDLRVLRHIEQVITKGKRIIYPKIKVNEQVKTELDKFL